MAQRKPQRSKSRGKELRKLAAIMFTDMVGYSGLAQKNEKLALELLEEHKKLLRPVFPKFQGREIKTIGDAFLVEFASALDAAQCAVEIQKTIHQRNERTRVDRRFQIKIGLHVGDVVFKDKDVLGDGVNIASRIEPVAGPGGICISEDVARQIQNKIGFPLLKLGKGELKNIEVPVQLFRILLPWQQRVLPFSDRLGFLLRQKRSRTFAAVIGVLILLFGASWMLFQTYVSRATAGASAPEKSIAVLPFQNFAGGAEDEYFVDGMTESLITDLAKVPGLFVIARNSMFQYKGKAVKVKNVGQELNVRYVLEGSIQRSGSKVRVNMQLIDAMTEAHIWSDRYDREVADIFALQDDLSMKIVQALQLRLAEAEQSMFKADRATNYEAQDLYWKGLQHSKRKTKQDNDQAIRYLGEALEKDPKYASAHATLASTLRFRYAIGFDRSPAILERAREHTARALEINPMHAEGMVMKGLLQREEGKLKEAIQTLLKEYESNPNDAQCLYYLGNSYRDAGYWTKAIEFHKKAFEIEPFYLANAYNLAADYWVLGKAEEVNRYSEKAIALDPQNFLGLMMKAYGLGHSGHEAEALTYMAKAIAAEPNHADTYGSRSEVYKLAGRFDEAYKDIQYLMEKDRYSLTGIASALPFFMNIGRIKEAERIVETSLGRPILPLALGIDYKALLLLSKGMIKREQGKQPDADAAFIAARKALEQRLLDFPDSAPLLSMHGVILACQGKHEEAVAELQKANAAIPGVAQTTFDIARAYALHGDKQKTLQYLRQAVEEGKHDFEMMRTDWFFKPLRKDAEFNALIDSFKLQFKNAT